MSTALASIGVTITLFTASCNIDIISSCTANITFKAYTLYIESKVGIFAQRAMVDQAREDLCYQRET